MKGTFVLFFLLILFGGCKRKQSNIDEVLVEKVEPPDNIDVSAPHIIFFTGGYVYDTLVVEVNDSIYLNTVVNTDDAISLAKGISVYEPKVNKIKLKSINFSNVIADTIYKPVFNYKWLMIRKEGNTFSFNESERAPEFR